MQSITMEQKIISRRRRNGAAHSFFEWGFSLFRNSGDIRFAGEIGCNPLYPDLRSGSLPKGGHENIRDDKIVPQWGKMSEGQKGVIWQPGETISSGVYLVRATTNDGQQITKRIVYLK